MKKGLKVIALATLVCFLTTQSVWGAPGATIEMAGARELPGYLNIDVPAEFGTVDALYEAPASGNPPQFILHIQNAHANYQAQIKIKQLLGYMNKKYGFTTIFVEGASEKLDADYLRLFPDRERNLKLCDELAKQGELTGAELFLMEQDQGLGTRDLGLETKQGFMKTNPEERAASPAPRVEALGIEQASLYKANYDALKKVFGAEADVTRFFKGFDGKLDKVASKTFTPETRELIADWKRFEQGRREFMPFVKTLAKKSKKVLNVDLESLFAQVGWPQITRLLVIQQMEKDLDRNKGIAEKTALLKVLREKGASKELLTALENFSEGSISVGKSTQEVSPREILERLASEMGPKGFKFSDYPAFSLYAGYVTLRFELDPKVLFEEIEYIFTQMLDTLAEKPEQKALLALYRDGELVRKLLHLELNRAQWRQVVEAKDRIAISSLVARLKDAVQKCDGDSGLGTRNSKTRETKTSPEERATSPASSARALDDVMPPVFAKKMSDLFAAGLEFYDYAHKREGVFYKEMRSAMAERKITKAILITGGFHTDGMSDLFRENAVSYGIVTPRLSEKSDEGLYRKIMLQDEQVPFNLSYLEAAPHLADLVTIENQGLVPVESLKSILKQFINVGNFGNLNEAAIRAFNTITTGPKYNGVKVTLELQGDKVKVNVAQAATPQSTVEENIGGILTARLGPITPRDLGNSPVKLAALPSSQRGSPNEIGGTGLFELLRGRRELRARAETGSVQENLPRVELSHPFLRTAALTGLLALIALSIPTLGLAGTNAVSTATGTNITAQAAALQIAAPTKLGLDEASGVYWLFDSKGPTSADNETFKAAIEKLALSGLTPKMPDAIRNDISKKSALQVIRGLHPNGFMVEFIPKLGLLTAFDLATSRPKSFKLPAKSAEAFKFLNKISARNELRKVGNVWRTLGLAAMLLISAVSSWANDITNLVINLSLGVRGDKGLPVEITGIYTGTNDALRVSSANIQRARDLTTASPFTNVVLTGANGLPATNLFQGALIPKDVPFALNLFDPSATNRVTAYQMILNGVTPTNFPAAPIAPVNPGDNKSTRGRSEMRAGKIAKTMAMASLAGAVAGPAHALQLDAGDLFRVNNNQTRVSVTGFNNGTNSVLFNSMNITASGDLVGHPPANASGSFANGLVLAPEDSVAAVSPPATNAPGNKSLFGVTANFTNITNIPPAPPVPSATTGIATSATIGTIGMTKEQVQARNIALKGLLPKNMTLGVAYAWTQENNIQFKGLSVNYYIEDNGKLTPVPIPVTSILGYGVSNGVLYVAHRSSETQKVVLARFTEDFNVLPVTTVSWRVDYDLEISANDLWKEAPDIARDFYQQGLIPSRAVAEKAAAKEKAANERILNRLQQITSSQAARAEMRAVVFESKALEKSLGRIVASIKEICLSVWILWGLAIVVAIIATPLWNSFVNGFPRPFEGEVPQVKVFNAGAGVNSPATLVSVVPTQAPEAKILTGNPLPEKSLPEQIKLWMANGQAAELKEILSSADPAVRSGLSPGDLLSLVYNSAGRDQEMLEKAQGIFTALASDESLPLAVRKLAEQYERNVELKITQIRLWGEKSPKQMAAAGRSEMRVNVSDVTRMANQEVRIVYQDAGGNEQTLEGELTKAVSAPGLELNDSIPMAIDVMTAQGPKELTLLVGTSSYHSDTHLHPNGFIKTITARAETRVDIGDYVSPETLNKIKADVQGKIAELEAAIADWNQSHASGVRGLSIETKESWRASILMLTELLQRMESDAVKNQRQNSLPFDTQTFFGKSNFALSKETLTALAVDTQSEMDTLKAAIQRFDPRRGDSFESKGSWQRRVTELTGLLSLINRDLARAEARVSKMVVKPGQKVGISEGYSFEIQRSTRDGRVGVIRESLGVKSDMKSYSKGDAFIVGNTAVEIEKITITPDNRVAITLKLEPRAETRESNIEKLVQRLLPEKYRSILTIENLPGQAHTEGPKLGSHFQLMLDVLNNPMNYSEISEPSRTVLENPSNREIFEQFILNHDIGKLEVRIAEVTEEGNAFRLYPGHEAKSVEMMRKNPELARGLPERNVLIEMVKLHGALYFLKGLSTGELTQDAYYNFVAQIDPNVDQRRVLELLIAADFLDTIATKRADGKGWQYRVQNFEKAFKKWGSARAEARVEKIEASLGEKFINKDRYSAVISAIDPANGTFEVKITSPRTKTIESKTFRVGDLFVVDNIVVEVLRINNRIVMLGLETFLEAERFAMVLREGGIEDKEKTVELMSSATKAWLKALGLSDIKSSYADKKVDAALRVALLVYGVVNLQRRDPAKAAKAMDQLSAALGGDTMALVTAAMEKTGITIGNEVILDVKFVTNVESVRDHIDSMSGLAVVNREYLGRLAFPASASDEELQSARNEIAKIIAPIDAKVPVLKLAERIKVVREGALELPAESRNSRVIYSVAESDGVLFKTLAELTNRQIVATLAYKLDQSGRASVADAGIVSLGRMLSSKSFGGAVVQESTWAQLGDLIRDLPFEFELSRKKLTITNQSIARAEQRIFVALQTIRAILQAA